MNIANYISKTYPTVSPFCGIDVIEGTLLENDFVVVKDDGIFYGILSPQDIIKRPKKIVIDCLSEKEKISGDDTITIALEAFHRNKAFALPVFNNDNFIGIIEKRNIIQALTEQIDVLYKESILSQEVKTHFIRNLSHEVRTPLNSILGFLDIISNLSIEDFKDESREQYDIVKNNAEHYLMIMSDLISLSLFHSGDDVHIQHEVVILEDIFIELKEIFEFGVLYKNYKQAIKYINPDISLSLNTDGKKIKHILFHLIDNAIKFSDINSTIIFGIEKVTKTNVHFFVTNYGIEIEKEKQKNIFQIFEQQVTIGNQCNTGFGIGLTIVKTLTELLKGNIDLVSDKNGTTFKISIPIINI